MTNTAIQVENLSKRYVLGEAKAPYGMLRDALVAAARAPFQARRPRHEERDEFWALRDVSFEVEQGQVLGIIGRNGAGKSTLLKVLSRITEPTTGLVRMRGRVRALLEVGTGFHPELTGRENIYLNGVILGMKRREIDRKYDEIVAFAEIQRFIDTPVKRYSSGMYTRLAFSIAAHLEPEILIVDEVLAVGDAAFQQKCLGKMDSFAKEGRTVLFVTHNLGLIQTICTKAILLQNGTIRANDTASATVATYLRYLDEIAALDTSHRSERRGSGEMRFTHVAVANPMNQGATVLSTGQPARFTFEMSDVRTGVTCSFTIFDAAGQPITFGDSATVSGEDVVSSEMGQKFLCEIDELPLVPGRYRMDAAIVQHGETLDHLDPAAFFDVEQGQLRGRAVTGQQSYGSVLIPHRWVLPK